jgi:methionine-rich copper-binding protein CopC
MAVRTSQLVATMGATAALTATAYAHAPVEKRTPRPGSAVSHVRKVSVTFGESVVAGLIEVRRGGRVMKASVAGLRAGNHRILRARFAKPLARGR